MTPEEEKALNSGLKIWMEAAIKVSHPYMGGPNGGFMLLPLGLRLNRDVEKAKPGTPLEFITGERARLIGVKCVPCNDTVTNGLSTIRYGLNMKELRDKWRKDAVYTGSGINAIDKDVCLVVFYKRKEGTL